MGEEEEEGGGQFLHGEEYLSVRVPIIFICMWKERTKGANVEAVKKYSEAPRILHTYSPKAVAKRRHDM